MYQIRNRKINEIINSDCIVLCPTGVLLRFEGGNWLPLDPNEYEVIFDPIPTKEQFCALMNGIIDSFKKQTELNRVLSQISSENFLSFPDCMNAVLNYLKDIFKDKDEWIDYYIYELECGNLYKPGMVLYHNTEIPLKTPEDLYDILIDNLRAEEI